MIEQPVVLRTARQYDMENLKRSHHEHDELLIPVDAREQRRVDRAPVDQHQQLVELAEVADRDANVEDGLLADIGVAAFRELCRRSLRQHLAAADRDTFVSLLDGVYEHSPWIADAAWSRDGK